MTHQGEQTQNEPKVRSLSPLQIYLTSLIFTLLFLVYCFYQESSGFILIFAIAVSVSIATVCALITRRLLFSICLVGVINLAIIIISEIRHARENMTLHSWDVIVFIKDPLSQASSFELCMGALAFVSALALLLFVYRKEQGLLKRSYCASVLTLSLLATTVSALLMPERSQTQYFWPDLHLSNFYRSLNETFEALSRKSLVLASADPLLTPASNRYVCQPNSKPVHIILIHEESVMVPDIFPDLEFDRSLLDFYKSDDEAIYRLRVETYGGASWLTQFSIFTGASTHSYGSIRNFVQIFSAGKLQEAIPQVLAECGYQTIMFTPWRKTFMSMARFYESIGFKDIADSKVQGNERENERDRFFFANVLNRIDQHRAQSSQPLFLYIETMSAHWPYDEIYMPEVDVKGGGPATPPEMSEYLRRLAMVKMDDQWFRAELARRFPNERFLIFRYGDHHPVATMPLLGEVKAVYAEDTHFPIDSPAFHTFFATNGIGYTPPPLPKLDMIDVPYLGGIMLQSAGLPLPELWKKRMGLMATCQGRFWSCPDHQMILDFNRELINAHVLNED